MKRSFPPAELNYSHDVLLSTKITYPLIGEKRKGNMVSRRMQKSRNSECWILGAGFWILDTGCLALPVTSSPRSISKIKNNKKFKNFFCYLTSHISLFTFFSHPASSFLPSRVHYPFIILPLSFHYPSFILPLSFHYPFRFVRGLFHLVPASR